MASHLDADAVEQLTLELMTSVRAHYMRRPTSRSTAQEILNAAAIIVAMIFTAARECGDELGARDFFDLALQQQLESGELPTNLAGLDKRVS